MLHNHGHFFGVAIRKPIGNLDIGVHGVEGDEEMMLAGQAIFRDVVQHLADQATHGTMHQFSVVDRSVHFASRGLVPA